MLKHMATAIAVGIGIATAASPAHAIILAEWNFNSAPPDTSPSTGSTQPSAGVGSAGLFGFTSFFFATGAGSTDPTTNDNTAWFTRPYPAEGTDNMSAGAIFSVSTAGYKRVVVTFDQRHASNASKFVQMQYTLDGLTFADAPGGLFTASMGGDIWYLERGVDFTGVPGVDDNALFAVRIVPMFAPGTTAYEPSSAGATYGQNGTLSYDMVTFSAAPIPEPGRFALFAAGLGVLFFRLRARRARRSA